MSVNPTSLRRSLDSLEPLVKEYEEDIKNGADIIKVDVAKSNIGDIEPMPELSNAYKSFLTSRKP